MASVRAKREKLFFDFRWKGRRCREYTDLEDTKENRKAAQRVCDRIKMEMALGLFDYEATFPRSGENRSANTEARSVQGSADNLRSRAALSSPSITLTAFGEIWFRESKVGWRRSYIKTVEDILANHINPGLGHHQISAITRADLLSFRSQLAEKPGRRPGTTLSAIRINTIMLILSQVLAEASLRHEFSNPFTRIKRLKASRPKIDPFTLAEVERILEACRADFRPYLTVRFFTGMRTGEIHGLKWKYVDFERRQILIRETIVSGEEDYTKNEASQREIVMSSRVLNALASIKPALLNPDAYVFCNRVGQALDLTNITKRLWYPLLRHLGLAPRRPYQTRHTAATLWLAAGESPEWIARQLGHANTQMLFTTYSRYVPNTTRADGSAIERLLGNGKTESTKSDISSDERSDKTDVSMGNENDPPLAFPDIDLA